jgi:hypothetical protein
MMNSLRWMAAYALCLALCAACAKSKGPQSGTNTNWLKSCDATVDCHGDGDCLCGVCTLACTSNAACSPITSPVRCTPASEDVCGVVTTGSVCLPVPPTDAGTRDSGTPSASDAGTSSGSDAGLTLTRVGSEVPVTDRYRPCGLDEDCVLVGTSCNGCCEQDAIRAHDREAYRLNHALACSDYQGPECDCEFADLVPRCQNGRCRAVPGEPGAACFSPTQNLELAYLPGAIGCACAQVGLRVCADGKSLACREGAGGRRWQADEFGGTCNPSRQNCTADDTESLRADADACLAEFTTCVEQPTGGFCGEGCYGPTAIDCGREPCSYEPLAADACEDDAGIGRVIWEGVCGDVRYREEREATSGALRYWSEATGELLAITYISDAPDFCRGASFGVTRGDFTIAIACRTVRDDNALVCSSFEE